MSNGSSVGNAVGVVLAIGAIGGLLFGGFQSCIASKHYAVSVQPRLASDPFLSSENDMTYVSLENVGLGPAIFEWTQVRVKCTPPQGGRHSAPVEDWCPAPNKGSFAGWKDLEREAALLGLPKGLKPSHYSPDDSLRPEYRGPLVGWNHRLDNCDRERFRELLKQTEYRACYKSLSGDRWTLILRLYGPRRVIDDCEATPEDSFERVLPIGPMEAETTSSCVEEPEAENGRDSSAVQSSEE